MIFTSTSVIGDKRIYKDDNAFHVAVEKCVCEHKANKKTLTVTDMCFKLKATACEANGEILLRANGLGVDEGHTVTIGLRDARQLSSEALTDHVDAEIEILCQNVKSSWDALDNIAQLENGWTE